MERSVTYRTVRFREENSAIVRDIDFFEPAPLDELYSVFDELEERRPFKLSDLRHETFIPDWRAVLQQKFLFEKGVFIKEVSVSGSGRRASLFCNPAKGAVF